MKIGQNVTICYDLENTSVIKDFAAGSIDRITNKAVFAAGMWIPKSIIEFRNPYPEENEGACIIVPRWFWAKI